MSVKEEDTCRSYEEDTCLKRADGFGVGEEREEGRRLATTY